jgi:hypothetical protein
MFLMHVDRARGIPQLGATAPAEASVTRFVKGVVLLKQSAVKRLFAKQDEGTNNQGLL